ncbi:MAG: DUF4349 domain-containing protein [Bacteroidales bacterium]|nr:DUF4349 domain-containing protein [Bacteroidales bacterium]
MSRYYPLLLVLLIPALAAPGCGDGTSIATKMAANRVEDPAAGQAAEAKPAADQDAISRKIIYNASLEVVVQDLTETTKQIEKLILEQKGYIAKSDSSGDTGARRTATWVLKIPAEQFRFTMNALAALGTPVRNSSDSQDVTEEFLDLQARVKNLKAEEEALNKMVREAATLDAILKIRREITELRGNIERAEGRLKYLATMSAMSTITLMAREDAAYVPPTLPEPPTFLSRVQETFSKSSTQLRNFGESVGLIVVALVPWLPLLLVGVWLLRRVIRSIPDSRVPMSTPQPSHQPIAVAPSAAAAPESPHPSAEPPAS